MTPGPATSQPGDLLNPLNQAFESSVKAVNTARSKFNECSDNISDWKVAAVLGPAVTYLAKKKLDEIDEKFKKLVKLVETALQHQTPVISLINQSFNWLHSVQTPMSEMSAPAITPRDQNFEYWRAPAGFAYRTKATAQQNAINGITDSAKFISEWLFEIAQTNVDYLVELADFGAKMAGELAQAAAETATIIDIPWAISTAANLIGSITENAIKRLIDVVDRFVKALGKVREIEAQIGDHSKFPGGKWPEAVIG
jgi:hypothetical protein